MHTIQKDDMCGKHIKSNKVLAFLVLVFGSLSAASFAILYEKSRELLGGLLRLERIGNSDWKYPCFHIENWNKSTSYLQDYGVVMVIFLLVFVIFAILAYFVLKDFDIGGQKEELIKIRKELEKLNKKAANDEQGDHGGL